MQYSSGFPPRFGLSASVVVSAASSPYGLREGKWRESGGRDLWVKKKVFLFLFQLVSQMKITKSSSHDLDGESQIVKSKVKAVLRSCFRDQQNDPMK